jgi:hypothetical protein
MIIQTNTTTPPRNFFAPVASKLAAIAEMLMKSSHLHRRAREAQRYFAMSDEGLARHGLKRDDIVRHVFGPLIYL